MRASVTDDSPSAPLAPERSLVPVSAGTVGDAPSAHPRPSAPFLAQLIAVAQDAPQTRVRRRAGADDTTAAYEAAAGRLRVAPPKLARMS